MDYYHILKINQTATNKEIKQHYYQLAKKYHPDKTKGDPDKSEKFKLLSEAYSTLSNPKKRYLYDLKNNYDVDINLNFTDKDYEQLHYYYNKIMNFTEIKFIRLLFSSLPSDVRINIKNKISNFINLGRQREGQKQIIHLRDIKYINIQHLKDNYTLNLIRNFDDIYNNKLKQIIIIGENIYHLFITSYKTSGAREIILINASLLNSRDTGPKTLVPIGCFCALIKTAAFSSKLIEDPSAHLSLFFERTITASNTSPFLTLPVGIASFTVTLITYPTVAYLFLDPPKTLMHINFLAPLLSATSKYVCS